MEIKLLIADDHRLFRESLSNLFTNKSLKVIGMASNGSEAIELARKKLPDVILMDIGMDGMDGITATRILKKDLPNVKIVGLSMHADKNYIKGMLEAGAHGYLLKSCSYAQLVDAINAVHQGNKYLTDDITRIVVDDIFLQKGTEKKPEDLLTEREKEVLKLYSEGFSTRNISEKLFISIKTVGTHKLHILKKLKLKSVGELIKFGIKKGLVNLN